MAWEYENIFLIVSKKTRTPPKEKELAQEKTIRVKKIRSRPRKKEMFKLGEISSNFTL